MPYKQGVTGSNPVAPTEKKSLTSVAGKRFFYFSADNSQTFCGRERVIPYNSLFLLSVLVFASKCYKDRNYFNTV